MKLGEQQRQLLVQLVWGVLLGALILAIFYGPLLPDPLIFGVRLGRIAVAGFVTLALGASLVTLLRALMRHKPVAPGQTLLGVLPLICTLNIAGKNPVLIGMIIATIAIDLFTAALVWLRDGQRKVTQ